MGDFGIHFDNILNGRSRLKITDPTQMDSKVVEAFQDMLSSINEDFPVLGDFLKKATEEGMSEEDIIVQMMGLVQGNPEMEDALTTKAMAIMEPLREEGSLHKPQTEDGPGIVFDPGSGLPRLNPLYEAAVIEKLQFDGDIPEFRSGPLMPGTSPAVPVETDARSPVALGHMLETASKKVASEVHTHRKSLLEDVMATPEAQDPRAGTGTDLVPREGETDLIAMASGTALTDPPSYRRGEVPSLFKVDTPTGGALAALDTKEQRQMAWHFLSTSQGRRSAEKTLWTLVATTLRNDGVKILDNDHKKKEGSPEVPDVIAYTDWTMSLGEQGTTQQGFSLIDVASGALAHSLSKQMGGKSERGQGPLILEIHSINTVDVRSVGWAARIVR